MTAVTSAPGTSAPGPLRGRPGGSWSGLPAGVVAGAAWVLDADGEGVALCSDADCPSVPTSRAPAIDHATTCTTPTTPPSTATAASVASARRRPASGRPGPGRELPAAALAGRGVGGDVATV